MNSFGHKHRVHSEFAWDPRCQMDPVVKPSSSAGKGPHQKYQRSGAADLEDRRWASFFIDMYRPGEMHTGFKFNRDLQVAFEPSVLSDEILMRSNELESDREVLPATGESK